MVNQLLRVLERGAANTGSYSDACKRSPFELVLELGRAIATLLGAHTTAPWLRRDRHINRQLKKHFASRNFSSRMS